MTDEERTILARLYIKMMLEVKTYIPDLAQDMAELIQLLPMSLTREQRKQVDELRKDYRPPAFNFDDDDVPPRSP